MKRVSSQLILCSTDTVLRNTVIEQNADGYITNIFDLTKQQAETAHTRFYDGIISSSIISIKEKLSEPSIQSLKTEYNYIDFSSNNICIVNNPPLPLLIDFGTTNYVEINKLLKTNHSFLSQFSAFEIINACTSIPANLTISTCNLATGNKLELLLWKDIDLVTKQIRNDISITLL